MLPRSTKRSTDASPGRTACGAPVRSGRGWRRPRRKGFTAVLFTMIVVVGIVAMALVLNWVYLLMVSQRTTQTTDVLALGAAQQLLDENILLDMTPTALSQSAAEAAATSEVDDLRIDNNAAAGRGNELEAADVTVTPGYVNNVNDSEPFATSPYYTLTTHALAAMNTDQAYNALRVEVLRSPTGSNPVRMLVRGFGAPSDGVKMSSVAIAALDNRVVGFRPTSAVASPVAPLAIDTTAWHSTRVSDADDSFNGNLRYELDVMLDRSSGGGSPNSALVNVDDSAVTVDLSVIDDQIRDGIFPGDLSGTTLGPASMGSPLSLAADASSPTAADATSTDDIVMEFNTIAVSDDPRRGLPIESLVAAESASYSVDVQELEAENTGTGMGYDELRVRIEPAFIVHFTAETDQSLPDDEVNPYIYKLRLIRHETP